MNVTGGRALELLLALGVVLLLLVTPTADLWAFGFHEHIVVPERGSNLTGPGTAQEPIPSHHCELSVSAGDLVPGIELAMPALVAIDPPEQRASALSQRPFVPLTPPRA
jgi:hypothetical protein